MVLVYQNCRRSSIRENGIPQIANRISSYVFFRSISAHKTVENLTGPTA